MVPALAIDLVSASLIRAAVCIARTGDMAVTVFADSSSSADALLDFLILIRLEERLGGGTGGGGDFRFVSTAGAGAGAGAAAATDDGLFFPFAFIASPFPCRCPFRRGMLLLAAVACLLCCILFAFFQSCKLKSEQEYIYIDIDIDIDIDTVGVCGSTVIVAVRTADVDY